MNICALIATPPPSSLSVAWVAGFFFALAGLYALLRALVRIVRWAYWQFRFKFYWPVRQLWIRCDRSILRVRRAIAQRRARIVMERAQLQCNQWGGSLVRCAPDLLKYPTNFAWGLNALAKKEGFDLPVADILAQVDPSIDPRECMVRIVGLYLARGLEAYGMSVEWTCQFTPPGGE